MKGVVYLCHKSIAVFLYFDLYFGCILGCISFIINFVTPVMPYWICRHKLTKEKIRRCKGCVGGHSVPRVVFQFSSKSLLSSVFLLSLSLSSQTWREQHQHCRRSKFDLICEKVISDFVLFSDLQLCVSSVSDNTGCVLLVWLK